MAKPHFHSTGRGAFCYDRRMSIEPRMAGKTLRRTSAPRLSRAEFLGLGAAATGAVLLGPLIGSVGGAMAATEKIRTRPIPKTAEQLPVIGLGTWQSFDIGPNSAGRAERQEVLRLLFEAGGSMIDSSPMYGRSEGVVGDLLEAMNARGKAFLATKVWTWGEEAGQRQMDESFRRFRTETVDLMQIHNLVDWRTHLRTLRVWKEGGRIRYIGITHYTDTALAELANVIRTEPVDFVQLPYSIGMREAERELLPLAQDKGVAVIVNRPFEGGTLFRERRTEALPEWAAELGIESWAQFFLKFVLSHPAVTCVIPGTAKPKHMADNLNAGRGSEPDSKMRERMLDAAQPA
jgi:diketogulonate reductase-like aldo/keto reductase